MLLRQFTPAQSYMLANTSNAWGHELMRLAFLDLIYKDILKITREWRLPHPSDSQKQLYTFVCRGGRFYTYLPNFHQNVFLQPFAGTIYAYPLKTFIDSICGELGGMEGFKYKLIYKELGKQGFFFKSFGLPGLNIFMKSPRGLRATKVLKARLMEGKHHLLSYMANNRTKAREMLYEFGAHILLLKIFHPAYIQAVDRFAFSLSKITPTQPNDQLRGIQLSDQLFLAFCETMKSFNNPILYFDELFKPKENGIPGLNLVDDLYDTTFDY